MLARVVGVHSCSTLSGEAKAELREFLARELLFDGRKGGQGRSTSLLMVIINRGIPNEKELNMKL